MHDITILFTSELKTIKELSNIYGCKCEYIMSVLQADGYLYADKINKLPHVIIALKKASEEYFSDVLLSIKLIAKKYALSSGQLSNYLKRYLNVTIEPRRSNGNINDKIFDKIDSEEKAYWLGFIYADGYVDSAPLNQKRQNNYGIELSLALKDLEHVEKFKSFICSTRPIICSENRCRLCINSKHMWKTLVGYGCIPNKSLTLKFPNVDIFSNENLIKHFIRGYFDGDGCISYANKSHTIFTYQLLGTYDFITECKKWLPNELSNDKLYHNHNNVGESTMFIHGSSNKAIILIDFLYKDAKVYLKRKYERYLETCRFRK